MAKGKKQEIEIPIILVRSGGENKKEWGMGLKENRIENSIARFRSPFQE